MLAEQSGAFGSVCLLSSGDMQGHGIYLFQTSRRLDRRMVGRTDGRRRRTLERAASETTSVPHKLCVASWTAWQTPLSDLEKEFIDFCQSVWVWRCTPGMLGGGGGGGEGGSQWLRVVRCCWTWAPTSWPMGKGSVWDIPDMASFFGPAFSATIDGPQNWNLVKGLCFCCPL